MTSQAPARPQAIRSRKNQSHLALSFVEVTWRSRISRWPPPFTPAATSAWMFTTLRDSQLVSSSRRRWPSCDLRPLGQLSEGHEGDQRLAADQAGGKRPGKRSLVQQRGDISVQDGWVHG